MHGLILLAALIASRERFDAKPNNSDFDWSSPPEVWDKLLPPAEEVTGVEEP